MEGPSFRQLAGWLGRASAILSKDNVLQAMKMAEAVKTTLQRKVRALLRSAAGRPVLFSYSSDGTPMKVAVRVSSEGLVPNSTPEQAGQNWCT